MTVSRTTWLPLCLLPLLAIAEPTWSSPTRVESSKWTVLFDVKTAPSAGGESSEPKRILTIEVTGESVDQEVMVILEGDGIGRAMAPMIPGVAPASLSAGVVLDSLRAVTTTPLPNLLRIEATLARVQGMRLHRFLSRVVYVTLRPSAVGRDLQTANATPGSGTGTPELAMVESRPGVPAMPDGAIAETDLVVRSPPSALSGYWGEVKRLVNRSWRQEIMRGLRSERGRDPRVRFRLQADGAVQLIQLERSSGNQRLDEAALQAVVTAHPFPPFPSYLQEQSVDVHIDLSVARGLTRKKD